MKIKKFNEFSSEKIYEMKDSYNNEKGTIICLIVNTRNNPFEDYSAEKKNVLSILKEMKSKAETMVNTIFEDAVKEKENKFKAEVIDCPMGLWLELTSPICIAEHYESTGSCKKLVETVKEAIAKKEELDGAFVNIWCDSKRHGHIHYGEKSDKWLTEKGDQI